MTSTTSLVPAADASAPSLIKTDALGRLHRTPQQREQILDEYERSGLSGPKFAALCGGEIHRGNRDPGRGAQKSDGRRRVSRHFERPLGTLHLNS